MKQPEQGLVQAIGKFARAGISVEDMIRMLNAGITVETLLDLIERNLQAPKQETGRSSRWIH